MTDRGGQTMKVKFDEKDPRFVKAYELAKKIRAIQYHIETKCAELCDAQKMLEAYLKDESGLDVNLWYESAHPGTEKARLRIYDRSKKTEWNTYNAVCATLSLEALIGPKLCLTKRYVAMLLGLVDGFTLAQLGMREKHSGQEPELAKLCMKSLGEKENKNETGK
jgi:hypothetical protein